MTFTALHLKQSHRKKKKEFFRKLKRKEKLLASKNVQKANGSELRKSASEEQKHTEDIIKPSASSPLPSQAKEPSGKSQDTDDEPTKTKRFKRKKEHIRLGAYYPTV